ncbi:MAG TPA: 50S ribosomal protein L21 [Terriglobales bacterium]|nr:50S ribosomal protein L21 [Terriglobales bacterium]
MYAVIRTGGKQYRVAPGDVIRVEKLAPATRGDFQFNEVLAVSSDEGKVARAGGDVKVSARVLGEGRGEKILVFHYKRKKQYKKLQGHRQPFTAVQITEIAVNGQTFKADEAKLKAAEPKPKKEKKSAEASETLEAAPAKKTAAKKSAAKKTAVKKSTAKKK